MSPVVLRFEVARVADGLPLLEGLDYAPINVKPEGGGVGQPTGL